ncbi:type VII secretion integral membrane protein EccD [Nocardia sp. BMG111209]|uniref:type VII secretion integral membrane protein EccD n=1 Tax=Nocardia sp. BMG111209 TaxID=1160137 RepID=UPI00037232EE|nr:type VII secretion integral membrane protein EccD [Nocardia sp. BMG111209]
MTELSSSGSGAVEPDLCRVSVIGGNTQLDIGLPATVPIVAYITELVELIDSRNPDLTEHDDGSTLLIQHWTLARIGHDPIPLHRTLTDAEVLDGELLVLRSVTAKEAPALFDDVIDAVSRLTTDSFRSWSPAAARWMGLGSSIIAVVVAVALLAVAKGTGCTGGLIAAAAGLLVAGAAVIVGRRYPGARPTAAVLSLDAVLLLGSAAALSTPGRLSAAHLLFAGVATLVTALAVHSLSRAGALVVAVAVTGGLVLAGAALVRMVWDFELTAIAAGVVVAGLILITMAPRVALAAARLPVPPVPTAGGAIDPADHEPRPTIEDIGAIGATVLPSAAGLQQRAQAANLYQSGIILGAVLAVDLGTFLAADPLGAARWQGLALGAVVAVVLCLRGRAFADLAQAAVLIAGGILAGVLLLAGVGLGEHDRLPTVAGLVLVAGAAVTCFGVIGPHTEVSPVVRRAVELIEYLLIILIVPLVLWLMGIYAAARNI